MPKGVRQYFRNRRWGNHSRAEMVVKLINWTVGPGLPKKKKYTEYSATHAFEWTWHMIIGQNVALLSAEMACYGDIQEKTPSHWTCIRGKDSTGSSNW